MKKIKIWMMLYSFLCYILIGNVSGLYAQKQEKKITVALLNMGARSGISLSGAATLTDRLRTELVNLKVFTILERGQMNAILEEQGFALSGCTTSECAVEAGQLLGVQQMIAGDVGKVGKVITIDVRVFDVETGKILQAHQFNHEGSATELLLLMNKIAKKIAGLEVDEGGFPWLWVSIGAAVLGGTAALLLGGEENGPTPLTELPDPEWPPQN
jgi:TolB-like protein